MAKTYPNIGGSSKRKKWVTSPKLAPICDVEGCGCRATYRVEIHVNWFRGDDEVGNACESHKADAYALATGIPIAEAARREQQNEAEKRKAERKAAIRKQQLENEARNAAKRATQAAKGDA